VEYSSLYCFFRNLTKGNFTIWYK